MTAILVTEFQGKQYLFADLWYGQEDLHPTNIYTENKICESNTHYYSATGCGIQYEFFKAYFNKGLLPRNFVAKVNADLIDYPACYDLKPLGNWELMASKLFIISISKVTGETRVYELQNYSNAVHFYTLLLTQSADIQQYDTTYRHIWGDGIFLGSGGVHLHSAYKVFKKEIGIVLTEQDFIAIIKRVYKVAMATCPTMTSTFNWASTSLRTKYMIDTKFCQRG